MIDVFIDDLVISGLGFKAEPNATGRPGYHPKTMRKIYVYAYPSERWIKLKTNNPMERLLKEARRRTKVVGAFPDGKSALMLVAARLRHVSATSWAYGSR